MSSILRILKGPETPPPLLPAVTTPQTLPEEINAATRQTHTHLNRLITARLPLALPPFAQDPSTYLLGISQFAPVYEKFESLWDHILSSGPPAVPITSVVVGEVGSQEDTTPLRSGPRERRPSNALPGCTVRARSILAHIRLPGLDRAACLRSDISFLAPLLSQDKKSLPGPECLRLKEFTQHIEHAVVDQPHVLIAYAWILYMALFSGGRWIREKLRAAGPDFWQVGTDTNPSKIPEKFQADENDTARPFPGLTFLSFPKGTNDGLDLKEDFKARLAKVEPLLTVNERRDIIVEALKIFRFMILLVEELDSIAGPPSLLQRVGTLPPYSNIAAISPPRRRSSVAEFFSWASSPVSKIASVSSDLAGPNKSKKDISVSSRHAPLQKHVRWARAVDELEYPVQQPSAYVVLAIAVGCIGLVVGFLFWTQVTAR